LNREEISELPIRACVGKCRQRILCRRGLWDLRLVPRIWAIEVSYQSELAWENAGSEGSAATDCRGRSKVSTKERRREKRKLRRQGNKERWERERRERREEVRTEGRRMERKARKKDTTSHPHTESD